MEPAPLIVIVGETASGKSALAMKLAQAFNGEIISADSWAVYKGFDIGTAKPVAADQLLVRHHLIDVANPLQGFSAAVFQKLAQEAISDIAARGRLPILVGGSGLYIDAVLYNYSFLPAGDTKLRQSLNALTLTQLREKIAELQLDTTGIDLRNKRRLIRLIENNGVRPTKQALRANTLILGLKTKPDQLRANIEQRIEDMVAAGFVEEVTQLLSKYPQDIEAFRAPGYRAFSEFVQGKITLDAAKERFRQNDLQLAKKQRTWFKRNKSIHWIMEAKDAIPVVEGWLNKVSRHS